MNSIKLSKKYRVLFEIPKARQKLERNLSTEERKYWERLANVDTIIITGGRFSAKSFSVGLAACDWAVNYNHRILYTRYTNVSAKDSIIPEFEEKIDILNYTRFFRIIQGRMQALHNKAKIVFKGVRQNNKNATASLKSLKDFSCFILEEAEEMPDYDQWNKIKLSIRTKDLQNLSVIILNPVTKEHWIYKEFFEAYGVNEGFNGVKDNVCYIHSTYLDCIDHVPDNIIKDFERLQNRNPKKYQNVVMGGWLEKTEGVILENWEFGEFDESIPFVYGMDFGFVQDPTTLVKVALDGNKCYIKEFLYEEGLTTQQIDSRLSERKINKNDLIVGDGAEPRLIYELEHLGWNIRRSEKGAGSVKNGLKELSGMQIIVDKDSHNIVRELNNYSWSDKRSNTPIDAYNHSIDAIRYALEKLRGSDSAQIIW